MRTKKQTKKDESIFHRAIPPHRHRMTDQSRLEP